MSDEFRALKYHELRERLASFGVLEASQRVEGARVFYRPVMGLGSLYYPVAFRGEDTIVYPETIEDIVRSLGVPRAEWLELDRRMDD